ncbi:MAG: ABC transporter ATP-binding protein/permease [Treponemataceae bacterium]|nr:ABC transporter ATP-binding protein/permease [Treponemataceae bacterium]
MIKVRLIKLLSHAKKYVWLQVVFQWISLIAQVLLIYCLTSFVPDAASYLTKGSYMAEGLFPTMGRNTPLTRLIIIGLCILIRFCMDWLTSRTSFRASVDVKRILRTRICEKLLRLGSSYRDNVRTAEVVQLASEGVEQLEIYFGKYLSQFFYSLLCPLTLFAILSFVNIKAAAVLLVCVPLIPMSIVVVMKIAKRLLNKYWGLYAELGDSFLENLQGLTTLKIYRAEKRKSLEMDEEAQKFRHVTMKVLTMQLNSTSVMDIMAYGGAAVGMIVTLLQLRAGNVDLQGALMIILLAAEFFIPLRLLGSFFHIAMNGMAASDKIFALLDLPEPEEKRGRMPDKLSSIRFCNLDFSYGGKDSRQILHDVNIDCSCGITSFVGLSGCGKSTLAGILVGRNRSYEGQLLFEGEGSSADRASVELRQISGASLMENIVLVNHESYLFKGSIRDNLLMAKPEASDQELNKALEKVNLSDFAGEGLDYMLEEAASNLSGGQKQRLALARALLLNPKVYIFDEATSNIDVESEEEIMRVIHELASEKIVILISHRLANVTSANKIYFLQEGNITESGSHSQLLERDGEYAKLFKKQKELESFAKGEGYGNI